MVGIIGHMSGGKSYTSVSYMLRNLQEGHIVVSNIRLKCQGVSSFLNVPCLLWKRNYYYLRERATPAEKLGYHELDLTDLDSWPCGSPRGSATYKQDLVYIYIDEASSVWDSLTSVQDKSIQKVATWARHSEKRGQILYLIAQFSSELHKRLRNHIREYVLCKNSAHVRLPIIRSRLPPFLRHFIITTVVSADEAEILESSKWTPINNKIYDCYDTGQIVVGASNFPKTEFQQMRQFDIGGQIWRTTITVAIIVLLMQASFCVLCYLVK